MSEGAQPNQTMDRRARLVGGIVIAIAVLAMLALDMGMMVCDQQVTGAGNVVTVCRHMQATDPPILALGVVLLSGLGPFFTEISIFGFTAKRELKEVKAQQKETGEKVDKTAEKLDRTAEKLDENATDTADFHAKMLAQQAVPLAMPEQRATAPHPSIVSLAELYNQLRWTMPSGTARTNQMTQVVREMRQTLRGVPDFDVAAHLSHPDRGVRLAAYAYLNEQDAPQHFGVLVDAAVAEDKPFTQYWGLLAVRHQLSTGAVRLNEDARHKLTQLRSRLGRGTDRAQMLQEILG